MININMIYVVKIVIFKIKRFHNKDIVITVLFLYKCINSWLSGECPLKKVLLPEKFGKMELTFVPIERRNRQSHNLILLLK